ncbi:MAG TPA: NYN domain-containing protein [Flavobacterium sp.]|nr:NYN domain-containing protein [Flavobacterium sp.]
MDKNANPNRKKRVNFFVDGFNFYYGLKEMTKLKPDWRKFYWIDLVKLYEQFLSGVVHYFTARPKNTGKTARQNILMNCNKAINGDRLKIHYGKYQDKPIICRASCGKTFNHWEEKQTDVSLAIKMIEDCHLSSCEKIVLVSGDSDFLPPLRLIINLYSHFELAVLFPPCKFTVEINNLPISKTSMETNKPKWNKALLEHVTKVDQRTFRIPTEWT